MNIADIRGKIALDDAFTNVLARVESGLASAERRMDSFGKSTKSFGDGLTGAGRAFAPISLGIAAFGGMAVKLAGDFEQTKIAFTTMLGSGEKAKKFLEELDAFAAKTPFQFDDLTEASKRLLAMGFAANDVIPMMTAVGDAVAGLGGGAEMIDRVTRALGQMKAKGKVSAEEMMQLAEAGIPAWKMLADQIGVSIPKAMKLAQQGMISGAQGVNAVVEGMGKQFGGMMEKQSKTLLGQFSTLKDELTKSLRELGGALLPFAGEVLKVMQSLLPHVKSAVEAFNALSPPVKNAVIVMGMLLAALSPVLLGLGAMVSVIGTAISSFGAIAGAAKAATTFLYLHAAAIGTVAAAAAALAAGYALGSWFVENTKLGQGLVETLSDLLLSLQGLGKGSVGLKKAEGLVGFKDAKAFSDYYGEIDRKAKAARLTNEAYANGLKKTKAAADDAAKGQKGLGDATDAAEKAAEKAKKQFDELVKKYRELNTEAGRARAQQAGSNVVLAGIGDPRRASARDVQSAIHELSNLGETGRAAANKIKDSWEQANGTMLITTAQGDKLAQMFGQTLNPAMEQTTVQAYDGKLSWEQWRAAGDRARETLSAMADPVTGLVKEGKYLREVIETIDTTTGETTTTFGRLLKQVDGGWQIMEEGGKRTTSMMEDFAIVAAHATDILRMMGLEGNRTFSGLAQGIQSIATGDIGGALGAGAQLSETGGALGNYMKFFSGGGFLKTMGGLLGGDKKQAANMREEFIDAAGGLDVLADRAAAAGVSLDRLLDAKKPADMKRAIDELNAALGTHEEAVAAVDEAIERYGFSVSELGPKWQQQRLDELAGGLLKDYKLLTASGIEHDTVVRRMGPSMNEYLQTVISSGAQVPEALRPALEAALRLGELTDGAGLKFREYAQAAFDAGATIPEALQASMDKLVVTGLLTQEAADKMDEFMQNGIEAGMSMPDALNAAVDKMVEMGVITSETGNKLKSLDGVSFTESLSQGLQNATEAIDRLTEALTNIPNVERTVTVRKVTVGGGGGGEPSVPSGEEEELPFLAGGGIAIRPTKAVVGDAGPEGIVPLDRLSQMIGSGGGNTAEVERLLKLILEEQQRARNEQRNLPRAIRDAQLKAGA